MRKTLVISFSLRNTYRVNAILYSLRQIPILKRLLVQSLYKVRALKVIANIFSFVWEVLSAFLGKFLYFATMITGLNLLYENQNPNEVFLHILLFLTIIGAFMNTYMFNPTKDKYYAMILMRMNSKSYTLVNYGYSILKVIIGFMPFAIYFGLSKGLIIWQCILIPFFVASAKVAFAASALIYYEKTSCVANENSMDKFKWIAAGLLLIAAYVLPVLGVVIGQSYALLIMILFVVLGIVSVVKIISFQKYHEMYRLILANSMMQMENAKELSKQLSQKSISENTLVSSNKKGFEFLNDIFIKRHKKILWKSSIRITIIFSFAVLGLLAALFIEPSIKQSVQKFIFEYFTYTVIIMYSINRGSGFTSALFMNCDHSLLTYSFYKHPRQILKLFTIRLKEIIKINLIPAIVVSIGISLSLYVAGGAPHTWLYAVIILCILSMSIVFSVHYLTLYYLLQPYNAATKMKSAIYPIIMYATYFLCIILMNIRLSVTYFCLIMIVVCIIYSITACALVYFLAPKTFRLRS